MPRISVRANSKAAAAKAGLDDTECDVVIKSPEPAVTSDQLKNLRLGPVRLGDIATVKVVDGPVSMTRVDGQRAATITAKPTGDDTGAVSTKLQSKIDALKLPAGTTAEIGGVTSDQDSAFKNLGLAMPAAIAIVLIDLINQYLLRPILMTALATIFALLPMALGVTGEGGFIAQPPAVVVIGGLITSTLGGEDGHAGTGAVAGARGRVTDRAAVMSRLCILWLELLYGEGDSGGATAQGRPEVGRRVQAGRPARLRRHGRRLLGQIALGS
ncbi:efflux RND transporter permease subunit [Streptomyces sp. NPDC005648]|uniref:efflux RND transporter permease subunit n=1 Tax=Streptomyces sp. NPDC005648 TaxID=3157044 RepID=UPI0033BF258B